VTGVVKEKNTLYESWVDVAADIRAINAGEAIYDPATQQATINGRIYGIHENGTSFPVSGPGFIPVDRRVAKVLRILKRHGGPDPEAIRRIGNNPDLDAQSVEQGFRIWAQISPPKDEPT